MSTTNDQFEQHCLLELMGRQRIAGLVSERTIAGAGFLEVRVPETKYNPAFTRFISPNSLYAINPIDEKTCRMYAENLRIKPIDEWDIGKFMEKLEQRKLELAAGKKYDQDDGIVEEMMGLLKMSMTKVNWTGQ